MTSFKDAFRVDVEPTTGGWEVSLTELKMRTSGFVKSSRSFWIGIASKETLESRWNAKYKSLGMSQIITVYTTSSDDFRKLVEKELIDFYRGDCDNAVSGGGGPVGSPPYYVYIALKQ